MTNKTLGIQSMAFVFIIIDGFSCQFCDAIYSIRFVLFTINRSWSPQLVLLALERPDPPGGEVLPENLAGGVRSASQNPYPIYDQNLRYFLPYLWPDQNFETLFMTRPLHQNPVSDLDYN